MKNWMKNNWVISITAGILLGLSFPPINLSFLSIPAFMLFFYLAERSDSYKQLAYYSYAGLVIWNLITTYWLMMASLPAGIAAILANSVLMTIPLCLAKFFSSRNLNPILNAFLMAASWVGYEFLHHHWDLAWPWLAIGNGWSNHISLIQYISITGFLGISFWIVFTAALAYQTILLKQRNLMIATIAVFVAFPLWSFLMFEDAETYDSADTTEVAVIQPNHDSYQQYGGMSGLEEVMDSLMSLSYRTISPETDLIVWPENAIDDAIFLNSSTTHRMADSAKSWDSYFIAGTGLFELYDDENAPSLVRGNFSGRPYNYFNASIYVGPQGIIERYHKAKLVPIVERFPFVDFFSALDVFGWVDWGRQAGFGRGESAEILKTQEFETSGLICYDSVYPTWIREFVQNDATFITIITNDGWWGDTAGHHQHFAYARLRAIEFDRWIVRSANNGISGIIYPNGEIHTKTDYWVRTGFTADVENRYSKTFYTRFGSWLPLICVISSVLGWLFLLIKERIRK